MQVPLPSGKETMLLQSSDNKSTLSPALRQRKCVTGPLFLLQNVNQSNHDVSPTLCGSSTCPSNNTVLQQGLEVLVAGGGRGFLVAAREGRVDVDASQRGHRPFAVWVGLVAEGQLGGRGGAGGFLRDEESNKEGDDHGTRPQQEGRARDEGMLRERERQRYIFSLIFSSFIWCTND